MMLLKSVLLIALVTVAMIGVMVPNVFAESEEIDIKIIFVTSQNECENNWDDKIRSIDAISRSYFHQWGIDVMATNWDCIVEDDMTFEIQNARVSHDLTILVLDYVLSEKLMESNTVHPRGGHYMSGGDYDVIVTPASYSGYENERSVYVLIQEISHFAVNWYGYSCDVSNTDSCVHRHQASFDNCYAYGTPDVCLGGNLLATVEAPTSGIKYDVMSPLFTERYDPPVQKESVQIIWSDQPTNYQIGKQTLIEGKLVDSKNYPISGKIISIKDYNFGELVRTVTDKQGMFRYTWTPTSENNAIHAGFAGSDTMIQTGSMLTTNLILEKQTITPQVESKNNANVNFELWSSSMDLLKYELVNIGGYSSYVSGDPNPVNLDMYIQNNDEWHFVKSKRVEFDHTNFDMNFGYAGLFENGSYKVVASYYSKIAEQELTDIRYFTINSSSKLSPTLLSEPITWQEELNLINHYQNVINSFQSQSAKDLVFVSFIDGEPFSAKNMLKSYEKHNEVLGGWQIHLSYVDIVIEQAKIAEKQYQEQQKSKNSQLDDSDENIDVRVWKKLNYVYYDFLENLEEHQAYSLSFKMDELVDKGYVKHPSSELDEMRELYQRLNQLENYDIPELYEQGNDNYEYQKYELALINLEKAEELIKEHKIKKNKLSLLIQDAKTTIEQKSKITHLETKEQLEELFFQQYTLLDTIKSNFQKLDNEQILLKQKLENLPSISNPDYVDNGWDILKENQVKIDQLESLINGAKRELDAGRNESAEKYLESIEIKQHIIEKNLKLIQININNVEGGVPSEDSADGIYKSTEEEGGGCLIATATYGSEMAPQVQQLRELRDNQLLQTESGTQFMGMFNDVYYSFSPIIADYELLHKNELFLFL